MQASVLAWSHTSMFFKESKEIVFGGKAHLVTDILDIHICIKKKVIYHLHLFLCNMIGEGITSLFFVNAAKVIYRQMNFRGKINNG